MAKKYSQSFRHGRVWLGKRVDSGIWYKKYHLPGNPRPVLRSTGTTIKKEAIRMAEDLSSKLLNRELGNADGSILIKVLVDKFFTAKRTSLKPESLKRLRSTVHNLEDWIAESAPSLDRAKHVTPERIRQFRDHRLEYIGVAPRTADNDVANLCTIFKWGIKQGMVADNPADYSRNTGKIDLLRAPENSSDTYSNEEYHALVKAAGDKNDVLIRDLIIFLAGTGMRFEEAAHMTCDWLSWDEHEMPFITVRADNGWSPKHAGEVKQIPMLLEVETVLRSRGEGCEGYLFKNSVGNKIAANKTRERLQCLFPLVGIDRSKRRLHWHSFRSYFVKQFVEKGVSLNVLMSWTGHDTIKMAMHYAGAGVRDSIREIDRLKIREIRQAESK